MSKRLRPRKCCICGEAVRGMGHNAEPVKKGVCCDYCDSAVVFPRRLQQVRNNRKLK